MVQNTHQAYRFLCSVPACKIETSEGKSRVNGIMAWCSECEEHIDPNPNFRTIHFLMSKARGLKKKKMKVVWVLADADEVLVLDCYKGEEV